MGFGPCPFYRRPGVLVLAEEDPAAAACASYSSDDDEHAISSRQKKIGCIVSHKGGHGHGCTHSEFKTCYLCPQNPFYEVYFGRGNYGSGGQTNTSRMIPMQASESVIPVGTKILLSVHSVELLGLSNGVASVQGSLSRRAKRRRCRYDNSGAPTRTGAVGAGGNNNNDNDDEGDGAEYIECFVDVCRSFSPREGMAYVTIKVVHRNSLNAVDVRSLFVKPGDLKMAPEEGEPVRTHVLLE